LTSTHEVPTPGNNYEDIILSNGQVIHTFVGEKGPNYGPAIKNKKGKILVAGNVPPGEASIKAGADGGLQHNDIPGKGPISTSDQGTAKVIYYPGTRATPKW
jgi:hypothetical protein